MSREIKFRGKDITTGEWKYGFLVKDNEYHYYIIYNMGVIEGEENNPDVIYKEVIKSSVGEFTGLYDKNNKPIYEGDIVKFVNNWLDDSEFTEPVFWDYNGWKTEHNYECEGDFVEFEKMEIVGNIYENPELLKEME